MDELGALAVAAQGDDDARTGHAAVGGLSDGEAAGQRVESVEGAREGRGKAVDEVRRFSSCLGLGQQDSLLDVIHRDHAEIPWCQVHDLRLRRPAVRRGRRLWPDDTPGHDLDLDGGAFHL